MAKFGKPFDGAISTFYEKTAPKKIREAIRKASDNEILSKSYPYKEELSRKDYEDVNHDLQIELMKLQAWVRAKGERIVVIFEGRDAAGKGGTIKRLTANLNPRNTRVVALSKPSDSERGEWYFQRYIRHLPTAGELVFFDRSWYNRAVVEDVFGFCTKVERQHFFRQVPEFERMLVNDGIRLIKIWLTVGRAEQLSRFLAREKDPLKHWKLSAIDVEGLKLWDAYSKAISEMFKHTHNETTPWTVIRSDDKKRARLTATRALLQAMPYKGKSRKIVGAPDPALCGGPDSLPDENG